MQHPALRTSLLALAVAVVCGVPWPTVLAVAAVPAGCSIIVDRTFEAAAPGGDRFSRIQPAIDSAAPGDVVCVRSSDHRDERVRVTRSGTPKAPIRVLAVVSGPVLTAGFIVKADHVSIEGFDVRNAGSGNDEGRGAGIYIAGTGVKVVGNSVVDSEYDGIGCELYPPSCIDVLILRNIVTGANGSGIVVGGRRGLVEGNEVYGSVMKRDQIDADGIRFFGDNLTLRGNYIRDIYAAGYPAGEEPHTDCFQTFDDSKPASSNVLIEGNVCDRVDAQCLNATALTKKASRRITFRHNFCRVTNTQAILVREFPQAKVIGNVFTGAVRYRAILLENGARQAEVLDNVFQGPFRPYEIDESSRPGFRAERNVHLQ